MEKATFHETSENSSLCPKINGSCFVKQCGYEKEGGVGV